MASEDEELERWFAANLKAARKDAGLSQGALAARMREEGYRAWVQQTVTKVENCQRHVLLAEARALARVLDVPLAQLTDPPEAAQESLRLRAAMDRAQRITRQAEAISAEFEAAMSELRKVAASFGGGTGDGALAERPEGAGRLLKED